MTHHVQARPVIIHQPASHPAKGKAQERSAEVKAGKEVVPSEVVAAPPAPRVNNSGFARAIQALRTRFFHSATPHAARATPTARENERQTQVDRLKGATKSFVDTVKNLRDGDKPKFDLAAINKAATPFTNRVTGQNYRTVLTASLRKDLEGRTDKELMAIQAKLFGVKSALQPGRMPIEVALLDRALRQVLNKDRLLANGLTELMTQKLETTVQVRGGRSINIESTFVRDLGRATYTARDTNGELLLSLKDRTTERPREVIQGALQILANLAESDEQFQMLSNVAQQACWGTLTNLERTVHSPVRLGNKPGLLIGSTLNAYDIRKESNGALVVNCDMRHVRDGLTFVTVDDRPHVLAAGSSAHSQMSFRIEKDGTMTYVQKPSVLHQDLVEIPDDGLPPEIAESINAKENAAEERINKLVEDALAARRLPVNMKTAAKNEIKEAITAEFKARSRRTISDDEILALIRPIILKQRGAYH